MHCWCLYALFVAWPAEGGGESAAALTSSLWRATSTHPVAHHICSVSLLLAGGNASMLYVESDACVLRCMRMLHVSMICVLSYMVLGCVDGSMRSKT